MRRSELWTNLVMMAALAAGFTPAGCRPKDGAQGPPGAPGNTVIATPTTPNAIQESQDLPGVVLNVTALGGASGAGGAFQAGDRISVTFTLKKKNGQNLLASELDSSGIYVSGPSFNYQRVIPRISDFHKSVVTNADGSYTYTFPAAIPSVYAAPYNDSTDATFSQGELTGQDLLDGTYTIGIHAYRTYYTPTASFRDVANVEKDFLLGGATTLQPREVVKNANCNACHSTLQVHGGSRRDVKLCLLCHTSGGEDEEHTASIDFRVMIHKLHNASHLPSVQGVTTNAGGDRVYDAATAKPYMLAGEDYSHINFPVWPNMSSAMPKDQGYSSLSSQARAMEDNILKGVVACDKCHGDADGPGSGTAPAQGDFCTKQPSRRACGSCHDDIVWEHKYSANGQTMEGQGNDASCALCHVHSGTTFGNREVHVHPVVDTVLDTGVKVSIAQVDRIKTDGTVGTGNFQMEDRIQVTFNVKNQKATPETLPLSTLDSTSFALVGPSWNLQPVLPSTSVNPFDFTGRLVSPDTTDKGAMSKVVGATVTLPVMVLVTGATTFNVVGLTSPPTDLGTGLTLPAAFGTPPPSEASLASIIVASDLAPGDYTVTFQDAQAFTVAGPSGTLGIGRLPADLSSSHRFISSDGKLKFTVTVGKTNKFTAGSGYNLKVYNATAMGAGSRFAIVRNLAAFAVGDRFYYDVVSDATTSHVIDLPMDIPLEFLGVGDATPTQAFPPTEHAPVYAGRQSLYEIIASKLGSCLNAAAIPVQGSQYVDLPPGSGIASKDVYLLLDKDIPVYRECLQIRSQVTLANGNTRVYVRSPIRYARTAVPTVHRVTDSKSANLVLRLEGVDYSLDSATGVVTGITARAAGNPVVMTYRTRARFGWKRTAGGTVSCTPGSGTFTAGERASISGTPAGEAIVVGTASGKITLTNATLLAVNGKTITGLTSGATGTLGADLTATYSGGHWLTSSDQDAFDQSWGEWTGLSLQSGTYMLGAWCYKPLDYALFNGSSAIGGNIRQETQGYRLTSEVSKTDILFGSATEVETHALVSSQANCDSCHNVVLFHSSGSRRGLDTCLFCHGESGSQIGATDAYEFRILLHKIHRGKDLANALTYMSGSFADVGFPTMPGGTKHCTSCHGSNESWKEPARRTHPSQTLPTRIWRSACGSCHDSDSAKAHMNLMTDSGGLEACGACHGPGAEQGVELKHKNR